MKKRKMLVLISIFVSLLLALLFFILNKNSIVNFDKHKVIQKGIVIDKQSVGSKNTIFVYKYAGTNKSYKGNAKYPTSQNYNVKTGDSIYIYVDSCHQHLSVAILDSLKINE